MAVVSVEFIVFVAITVLAYYICPKRFRWCVLLTANIAFYLFAGAQYVFYIIGSTLVSYAAARYVTRLHEIQKEKGRELDRDEKKKLKAVYSRKRRTVLVIALVLVIGELALVKYMGFFFENLNYVLSAFGMSQTAVYSLAAPLGCSFYTFMIISYLVDVYRKKYEAQKCLGKYAAYVSFFPHITQGPIDRYDELAPQLIKGNAFKFENIKTGAILMLWGFFKKMVIADRIGILVDKVFGDFAEYSGIVIIASAVMYSIQIYADFSGYCDIVAGVAEMMGIRISKNFDRPYFSQTMPEFWRRWHITLGSWFKDYVLYPVSTSKICLNMNKSARKHLGNEAGRIISSFLPIMSVWFLTGFWHGAQWSFILWGLYHGVLIMLSLIFTPLNEKITGWFNIKTDCFSWTLFRTLRTFALCCVGRMIFKADSMADSFKIVGRAFDIRTWGHNFTVLLELGIDRKDYTVLIIAVLVLLAVSLLQNKYEVRMSLQKQNFWFRWIVLYALVFAIILFGVYGSGASYTSFTYEQF